MAIPSYATDLNDIYTDTDNFSNVGGGRETATETDDYIQGSNCWSHDPFSSGIEGGMYDDTTAPTITTDDAVFVWTKCDVAATLATHAAGGIQIIMGSSTTAYDCFYALGSDDYQYGGWKCIPVDPTSSPSTSVGIPGAYSWFGVRWNVPSTGASKGYPMKIDAIRYGRNLEITLGEVANPATWGTTAIYDSTTTRQWGICQPTNSGAEIQGRVYWGTAATLVYSRDSNKTITIIDTEWTSTDFTQVIFNNGNNDVEWDNVGLLALGTNNRGIIDVNADGAITWTNSVFQGIDITTLLSGCTFDGSKWLSCNEVSAGDASLLDCKILTPTVAADSHGLLWDTATDPNGNLDGMEFSKGTNSHHAIEFDATNTPNVITLTGIDFSGFNASNGQTDSTLYFPSTSKKYTVNLVGCTGNISYKVGTGGEVNLVADPVTVQVTVKDADTLGLVTGAQVLVWVTDGTNFPFEDSISITGATTTATVTHTAHGLATNDNVIIAGAAEDVYNGAYTITVTDANTYTYTTNETITVTPATGTTVSTFAFINDTTTATGVVLDSRVVSVAQPIAARIRKSTTSPLYKQGAFSDTVSSTLGFSTTVQLVSDE